MILTSSLEPFRGMLSGPDVNHPLPEKQTHEQTKCCGGLSYKCWYICCLASDIGTLNSFLPLSVFAKCMQSVAWNAELWI